MVTQPDVATDLIEIDVENPYHGAIDRAVDAVGVEAETSSLNEEHSKERRAEFERELAKIAPNQDPKGKNWQAGRAPSQALRWAVDALCKAGTLSIIGVYQTKAESFPIGTAMNKNLTIKMGNCNHRRYIPKLIDLVRTGVIDP